MTCRHVGKERGAALLVAMVMIFMLSIMGVSVMRSSAIEKRMATNAAQSTTTLYAAESVTEQMLNSADVLRDAGQNRRVVRTVSTSSVRENIGLETEAEILYVGDGPAFGFSSDFVTLRLVAQAEARIDNARTRSVVRQGAKRVVPALR